MVTVSIVHDHRGRAGKKDEGPLEVRVSADRKSWYISTGVKCRKSEFVCGEVVNRHDAAELNERVRIVLRRVQSEVNRLIDEGKPVNVRAIRSGVAIAFESVSDGEPFIDWVEAETGRLVMKDGTRKHYVTLVSRLREFGGIRSWGDVTAENIYRLDSFLHNIYIKMGENEINAGKIRVTLGDAAIYNYHKCLKAMINRAVKFGKLDSNPYSMLRGEFSRGEKESVEYLNEDEMRAVESLRPLKGSQMAMARDLFVFQMYTGLSYADTQSFNIGQYEKRGGAYRAVGERVKTGVPYVSRLLPPAVEVLEAYNMNLPKLNNADYNKMLKAIGMAAGIAKPLHSHMARHTFATFMLSNGVKIENLARMLGHTNIVQTQRYAKVLAKSVNDDFDKIAAKLADNDK